MNSTTEEYYEIVFWAANECDFDDVDTSDITALVDACHGYAHYYMRDYYGADFSSELELDDRKELKLTKLIKKLYEL